MSEPTTTEWTVYGGATLALGALCTWLKPFVSRWALQKLDRMHAETEARLARMHAETEAIKRIPSMESRQKEMNQYVAILANHVTDIRKTALLVVEDSHTESLVIAELMRDVAKEQNLDVIIAETHARARYYSVRAAVAVVDANLPDSTPESIRDFIAVTRIPCVIYTGMEFEDGFFGETPVVAKGESEQLKTVISRIVRGI